ncbi:hypothetical protein GCM10023205_63340 [Yinghuangia aomiensis]|uniref:DUF2029 domain-containing protein n=1 Tax=Yinghuangia aomiensis TaxID=676205 RepID=A0ABP9I0S6_9ACTN
MHISTPGTGTGRTAPRPPADRRSAGSRTAWTCAAAACATALGAVLAYAVHGPYTRPGTPGTYAVYGVAWALFALAALAVIRRVPARRALWLVWIGAVAFQIIAVSAPPQTSDDAYRYAWDGRVQAAGISPYQYAPQDPAVAHLRDDWLFPPGACRGWFEHPLPDGGCTLINRPNVHTIYPPVAQAWYLGIHAATPPGHREPVQIAAALTGLAVTGLLLRILRRIGRDPRYVVLWAWCPMVPLELGNSAHVDGLGVFLMLLGLAAVAARRATAGGVLLGAAIAVKMFPAAALVGASKRKPWHTWGAAVLTVAGAYVPYLLASGSAVVGYLPGYLREERYDDGARFGLLDLALPEAVAPFAAVAVLAATAALVARRSDPDRPWSAALTMTGVLLLVMAPNYPWYALLLVALVVLDGRVEWLAVGLAGYALYFTWLLYLTEGQIRAVHQGAYGLATAAVVGAAWLRRRRARAGTFAPRTSADAGSLVP